MNKVIEPDTISRRHRAPEVDHHGSNTVPWSTIRVRPQSRLRDVAEKRPARPIRTWPCSDALDATVRRSEDRDRTWLNDFRPVASRSPASRTTRQGTSSWGKLLTGNRSISPSCRTARRSGQVDGVEDIYDDEASGVVVLDAKRARALITELYAGAAAQLRFGEKAALVRATASSDDAHAARILESLSLPSRRAAEETRLRTRAARLVGEHWRVIVSVANELLKYRRLDFVHAELVMEIAEGRTSPATLEEYVESRELRPTIPERAGPRRKRRAAR